VIEVGCICNDAEITPDGLHGQPTEGALIAAALKVTNYFYSTHFILQFILPTSTDTQEGFYFLCNKIFGTRISNFPNRIAKIGLCS